MIASPNTMLHSLPSGGPRWIGAALAAVLLHAGIIAAALVLSGLQSDAPESGALDIDLPPMAIISTAADADNAENPQDAVSSPPPADGQEAAAQPAQADPVREEPVPVEKATENEPSVEPKQDAVPEPIEPTVASPQPIEDAPPVDESPLAPEPEVAMPKPVEPVQQKAPDVQRTEAKAEPKEPVKQKQQDKRRTTTADTSKAGAKSTSKASSAASGGGKFNPNAISRPRPAYPAGARASKTEGHVVVRYTVSASGAVTGVSVVSSSPPGVFNGVTVTAVRGWRFQPSASGGSGTTTIRFKLK